MIKIMAAFMFVSFTLYGTAHAEWEQFATGEDGPLYYDADRIINIPDSNDVGVWEKGKYGNIAISGMTKIERIKVKNYSYTISKHIFDCSIQQFMTSSQFAYSVDNKIVLSRHYNTSEQQSYDVIPESIPDQLMNILCKKK
jgi:hypothetical protein